MTSRSAFFVALLGAVWIGCNAGDTTPVEGDGVDAGKLTDDAGNFIDRRDPTGDNGLPPGLDARPPTGDGGTVFADGNNGGWDGSNGAGDVVPLPIPDGGTTGGNPRERCDDGLDNDGNGRVDDECPCLPGASQICFVGDPALAGHGPCQYGTQRCEGETEFGAWGPCMGHGAPQREVCDQQDNDCDGIVDEGCACRSGERRPCYTGAAVTRGVGLCRIGEQSCAVNDLGQATWGRCVGEVLPRPDTCDGLDNDCDGRNDENCECPIGQTRPCYDGPMGTSATGVCRVGTQRCLPGLVLGSAWGVCEGQLLPSSEDCSDRVDNDCNGRTDCADPRCTNAAECRPCMPGGERFTLTTAPADILFVVDRSGSMTLTTLDGVTRWNALVSAVRAVLPPLDASLSMGLIIYPDPDQCSVPSAPVVPISSMAASRITSALAARGPYRTALTPTYAALLAAEAHLRSVASTRRRFIVLATDGAPNCSGGVAQVVTTISRIRAMYGVDTFILGIPGSDLSLYPSLNTMAEAGGRARTGAIRFYDAGSTAQLETQLRSITSATRSCTYRFATTPSRPDQVTVQFDGRPVPRNGTDGWIYTDGTNREIRFNGLSCTQLNSGTVRTVNASFNC
jgi:hypothetical protein